MGRAGYQALGFAVWKGAKWYVRRRFGDAPRKVAAGGLVALVLAVLVLGARRATNG
ncbi:MAG: hypothetical protein M3155_09650 [Actinomycetota bacterium]|nr:hypothetical protein [Actinomycetota bacterium]